MPLPISQGPLELISPWERAKGWRTLKTGMSSWAASCHNSNHKTLTSFTNYAWTILLFRSGFCFIACREDTGRINIWSHRETHTWARRVLDLPGKKNMLPDFTRCLHFVPEQLRTFFWHMILKKWQLFSVWLKKKSWYEKHDGCMDWCKNLTKADKTWHVKRSLFQWTDELTMN